MEVWGRSAAVNRLTVLSAMLLLWALVIFGRLIKLQVIDHQKLLAVAHSQQEHKVILHAPRGTIFDRNGNPLAISVPADSVSVNPLQIQNTRLASEVLGGILNLDQFALLERLNWARDNKRGFLWVKRHLDPFETDRLKSLHLDWVTFYQESKRNYPKHQTAAHVLGAVYRVNDYEEGAAGVERSLEKDLKGRDGWERVLMDVKRRGIDSQTEAVPVAGAPLTLTIDERLQYVAERELKAGVEAKHAQRGSAIVMDPYTGEIYALANYPTYDPNVPPKYGDDPLSRFDLGASVPFEPGSVFKMVTLTAALETTNIRPETPINTGGGTLKLPGRVIHESHHGFGTITMQQVLEKSSNIGAILIGQRVGRENMYDYARRFGFGERTGLPVPGESKGMLRPLNRWGTTSLASISMGHEVSVTSAQLARAVSVIANGGMLIRPKLVLKRGDKAEPTETPKRIIKPETVMTMRMMMEGVVLRGTAARHVNLPGYTAAGKTGTAQIFNAATHHYTHDYNASFAGFTPVTNPRLVIVVTLNGTRGDGGMGAAAAAPVFQSVAIEALRMLDVPKDIPEGEEPKKRLLNPKESKEMLADLAVPLNDSSVMEEDKSVKQLLAQQVTPTPDPDEIPAAKPGASKTEPALFAQAVAVPVEAPVDSVPALIPSLTPPAPVVEPGKPKGPVVPDFRGKSLKDVVADAAAEGIEVVVQGSGVARAQEPPAGAELRKGARIRIVFSR